MAEEKGAEAPRNFAPRPSQANLKVSDFQEETVTMDFPHEVLLTLPTQQRILFPKGVQEVPKSLAEHVYLKAHGIKRYDPTKAKAPAGLTIEITEHHVKFLRSRGKDVATIADAQKFVNNLKVSDLPGFFAEAAAWQEAKPVDLTAMTKAQLVEHAAQVHGLELDVAAKKEELLASIADAQKKLAELNG